MFPVGNPWAYLLPYEGSPKREGEGKERQSALTCGDSRLPGQHACLGWSGPQLKSLVPAAGWSREPSKIAWRGCALGEPLHILPRVRFILSYRAGVLLDSHLLQPDPAGPASIKLKNSLKIPQNNNIEEKSQGFIPFLLCSTETCQFSLQFQFFSSSALQRHSPEFL